ncbi:MAG: hypothetical protein RMX65_008580 [Nostoc sp. DedQUE01]
MNFSHRSTYSSNLKSLEILGINIKPDFFWQRDGQGTEPVSGMGRLKDGIVSAETLTRLGL